MPNDAAADELQRPDGRGYWDAFVHTGPGTLAGRYLRTFWQPVYRSEDLAPGRAVPMRIMGEDLTLYRGGEAGAPHLLAFRCAHRGTQLSTGRVEGENLRCFYHGWMYGPDGQCLEQPAEPEPFCSRIKIKSYPIREYLGLIFAYLGEGETPPLPRYGEVEDEGVLEVRAPIYWPCNYFQRLENSADDVHVAFVHRESSYGEHGLFVPPVVEGRETDYGFENLAIRPGEAVRATHFHMPNINRIKGHPIGAGWTDNVSWTVPVDDEHCARFVVVLNHVTGPDAEVFRAGRQAQLERAGDPAVISRLGDEVLRGDLRIEEIEDRTFIVQIQDYVSLLGQGTVADRTHERLGRCDAVVLLLRSLWARELRALDEGRPLKRWHRPERLETTAGAPV